MRLAPALLLALVACSPPKPVTPPANHTASDLPHAQTPAPVVTWIDNGFDTQGLPAITSDGSQVIVPEIASDGGRGNPNLRLVARDRHDGVGTSITVLKVDEVDDMFEHDGTHPKLEGRMQAANGWLAQLARDKGLQPLDALDLTGDTYDSHLAARNGVSIEWRSDRLVIRDHDRTLYNAPTPATWQAAPNGGCTNPAKLGAAWISLGAKLALIEVRYNGTDTCWEPSPVQHVVSW